MSTAKHTSFGTAIHAIGSFFGTLFHISKKITVKDIQDNAETVAALANIYQEVHSDTAGITDPAQLATAVARSVIKHENDLPESLKGTQFENTIMNVCSQVSNLPLAQIEAIVKAELDALKGTGSAT